MDNYQYEPVNTTNNTQYTEEVARIPFRSRPFFRQLFVCSGIMCSYFISGIYFGMPTVTIPQLRRDANSTAAVSDEMASWLSSVSGYSSIPWIIILPIISTLYGRKKPFILSKIVTTLGYIVFCLSTTVTQILISEIIIGINISCALIISIVVASEYTSPQYRGLFLTLKSAMLFWGVWAANAIGTFFYWKNIGILALLCCIYCSTSYYWPESPYWLAANGRFEECIVSHRWLKGTGKEAEDELNKLIIYEKDYHKNRLQRKSTLYNIFTTFSCKAYYKPALLAAVCLSMYHFSGKLVCSIYAVEIMKKITDSEAAAYRGMLILDGVSVFSMYFGSYLSKRLKRRTLLFTGTSIGVSLLFTMSLYLYLVELSYIVENNVVCIILLAIYSVGISCGPVILSSCTFVELMPLRYKNVIICLCILFNNITLSTIVKLAPYLFKTVGIHGAFLCFGITETIIMLILLKYLPETKDKTLQEIEAYFKN